MQPMCMLGPRSTSALIYPRGSKKESLIKSRGPHVIFQATFSIKFSFRQTMDSNLETITLLDGCPYIPLSSYNWHSSTHFYRGCNKSLALNITVYSIFAAVHAVAVWMALGLILTLLLVFKRPTTLYFWYVHSVLSPHIFTTC